MTNPFSLANLAPTWVEATAILKGDVMGHEFHGNQWTSGSLAGVAGQIAMSAAMGATRGGELDNAKVKEHLDQAVEAHKALKAIHEDAGHDDAANAHDLAARYAKSASDAISAGKRGGVLLPKLQMYHNAALEARYATEAAE
jgi:hypothetical protein